MYKRQGVNDAIAKARAAGIYVIALDTPTDPPDAVDITFATDNREAGKLIGQYTACLLYTSDAADERSSVDLGGRRIIKKKNKAKHRGRPSNYRQYTMNMRYSAYTSEQ